jgi:NAD(P)-dependent dehydrogenase (short-subunit alcohol dehydrogenase family)
MQRVITAGAGGIGKEIARSFADVGASVFVCDIDAQGLAQLEHVLASDSAKSISGQILPIDNDMQQASSCWALRAFRFRATSHAVRRRAT